METESTTRPKRGRRRPVAPLPGQDTESLRPSPSSLNRIGDAKAPTSSSSAQPSDQDPELVRRWLLGALPLTCSYEQLRTVEKTLKILAVDYGPDFLEQRARLTRVTGHLAELRKKGGRMGNHLVRRALSAVSLPRIEALRLLAETVPQASRRTRSLKNFLRLAHTLRLSPRLMAKLRWEVKKQIQTLNTFKSMMDEFGVGVLRRRVQSPLRSQPILDLAAVFIVAGYSEKQAFERTAHFLQDWAPERYRELTGPQVRLRYAAYRRTWQTSPQEISPSH